MSWKYEQSTGKLWTPAAGLLCVGFAGQGVGLNNPAQQMTHDVGPLPQGRYIMSGWKDHDDHMGEGVIILTHDPGNSMFGRDGFAIHGLALMDPLHSSHGCICAGSTATRALIWKSSDHVLEVVA